MCTDPAFRYFRRTMAVVAVLLVVTGCVSTSGDSGESPEAPRGITVATTSEPPVTTSNVVDSAPFLDTLTAHTSGDIEPPRSLDDALRYTDVAVVGTVVGVDHGRSEQLGVDPASHEPIIATYVNLEIAPKDVLFGELPAPDESIFVEFSWPTNLPIAKLQAQVPADSRAIILASLHRDAEQLSASLIATGDSNSIPANLVQTPPWGLIIEGDSEVGTLPSAGSVALFEAAKSVGIDIDSFDEAVDVLRRTGR